jgi:hypothetical protein
VGILQGVQEALLSTISFPNRCRQEASEVWSGIHPEGGEKIPGAKKLGKLIDAYLDEYFIPQWCKEEMIPQWNFNGRPGWDKDM